MEEIFANLENEEVEIRLKALDELIKKVNELDKNQVINALKPHILDWDDSVREKVSYVLSLYTGLLLYGKNNIFL